MKPAEPRKGESGSVLGFGQTGLDREGLFVALEGFFVSVLKGERVAQAKVRGDERRIELERELKFGGCLLAEAFSDVQLAEA